MHKIGIDDGSSSIKYFYDGKLATFSSLIKSGGAFNLQMIPSAECYVINNNTVTVTESAVVPIPTNNFKYQVSDASLVLVHEAIRRAGIVEGEVTVYCTMPLARFFTADGTLNAFDIQAKKDNLMRELKAKDGRTLPSIVDVKVVPEGLAGAMYAISALELSANTLFVDVGGFTSDIGLTDNNGNIIEYATIENGTLQFAEQLGRQISQDYGGEQIPPKVAMNTLITGKLHETDYLGICQELISTLVDNALNAAKEMSDFRLVDNVIFIGGGANLIKQYNFPLATNMYIADKPEFANVNGIALSMG